MEIPSSDDFMRWVIRPSPRRRPPAGAAPVGGHRIADEGRPALVGVGRSLRR